jgi:1-acyl-sn-glycerol-3-phosphate acyltransferase
MPEDDTTPAGPAGTEPAGEPAAGADAAREAAGKAAGAELGADAPPGGSNGAGGADPRPAIPPTTVRAEPVDVHTPTALERTSYAIVRALFLGLAKLYFRLEIRGAENVPASGPFVLAPVHRSNLDFILVATVRRPRMRYMGKASIWKWAPLGKFVSMLGAFPVHRGTADRESLRTCMRVIENGESLVMFPEGTRKSGPTVDTLFDGPSYVAARAGVPLVPVGIGGSDRAMPKGAKYIRPRKIVIVVGEPIVPPVGEGTGRVQRKVVRQLTEQLHADVQRLYDEARAATG